MAVVSKTNPVGIDAQVDRIQKTIYTYLTNIAGWLNYESYPRAYKNEKDGGSIPEIYTGKNEYKECFLNDKYKVTSFFLSGDEKNFDNDGGQLTQELSIVFQADINKLYPAITHRADEEMHRDIFLAINRTGLKTYLESISTGIGNVYSDLDIPDTYLQRVKLDDISNYHIVKVTLKIPFAYCN